MQYTVNLNLKKPELTDYVDIRHINDNFDSLDTTVNNKVDKITGKGLSTEDYTTAEKTKLSGIEAGATADQTAAEILTAIKTVDGASSGLDADLLDGQHASEFALTGHAHTTFDRASAVLSGANVFSNIVVTDGITTAIATRALTATDLSLGSVMNYGIATQAEAQAGTSNSKYMTPLRVKEAILATAGIDADKWMGLEWVTVGNVVVGSDLPQRTTGSGYKQHQKSYVVAPGKYRVTFEGKNQGTGGNAKAYVGDLAGNMLSPEIIISGTTYSAYTIDMTQNIAMCGTIVLWVNGVSSSSNYGFTQNVYFKCNKSQTI